MKTSCEPTPYLRDTCPCNSQILQAVRSLHHAAPLGAGQHGNKWQDAKAFKTYQEMLQSEHCKPDCAFIGVPPQFHGGLSDKTNIEVRKMLRIAACKLLSMALHKGALRA